MKSDDGATPVAFLAPATHGLPGRLGFAPAPGRWHLDPTLTPDRQLECDLESLQACGTSVLVTLLEGHEMGRIGLGELLVRATRAGLETFWFPIPDNTAECDLASAQRLVEDIVAHLATGHTVVVHCHGGFGRSGTIVACCLVRRGADPRSALDAVRAARPGAASAPGQEEFVHAFALACAR
jgi:protein-tyrosine phosphatase